MEYSPGRSAFIVLILYKNGLYRYIVAPFQLMIGSRIYSFKKISISSIDIGCAGAINKMPIGTILHNITLISGYGEKFIRVAEIYVVLLRKEDTYCILRLRSGEQ